MARTGRIKLSDHDAWYHVTSRITGRQMLLENDSVKCDMLDALERAAEFSGVNVGSFAIMDNHLHVVLQVPASTETIPEREVLRRYCALMGGKAALRLEERICGLRERGDSTTAEAELDRIRARMHDLSQFVKTFKEEFGRLFRKRNPFPGTIWEGRFKSTLVGEAEYLRRCVAYVESNPVRAGLSECAEGYAWNTVGAAKRGNKFAKRCREWLMSVICPSDGDSPQIENVFLKRIAQISGGKILGSAAFVSNMLLRFSDKVRSRSAAARVVEAIGFASHGWKLAARLRVAA